MQITNLTIVPLMAFAVGSPQSSTSKRNRSSKRFFRLGESVRELFAKDLAGKPFRFKNQPVTGPTLLVFLSKNHSVKLDVQLAALKLSIQPFVRTKGARIVVLDADSLQDARTHQPISDVSSPSLLVVSTDGIITFSHLGDESALEPSSDALFSAMRLTSIFPISE